MRFKLWILRILKLNRMWIVGEYRKGDIPDVLWDFCGIFSSRQKAVAACRGKNYFIAPVEVDNDGFPDGTEVMPGVEYPLFSGQAEIAAADAASQ